MQSHPDNDRTPPFVTPATLDRDATPMTPTPVGKWPCPLPDEGVPLESTTGPCATKVVSDKKEDVASASCPEVDNTKTLTTAQGPDRSVHNSCTPATDRFLIDLEKKSSRNKRKSSNIPLLTPTPTNLSKQKLNTVDNSKCTDTVVNSVPQRQRQPPNEEEAGRRPVASLWQRSWESQPAEPQEGAAQYRPANQNKGLLLGGPRPHRKHQPPRTNLVTGEKNISKRYLKPPI
jgi:hypothetical protein